MEGCKIETRLFAWDRVRVRVRVRVDRVRVDRMRVRVRVDRVRVREVGCNKTRLHYTHV